MVNKIIIVGRLGKDPEMRYTQGGDPVTNFSVATVGGKEGETEWFNVVVWGKTAEACNQYLNKGSLVYIEGRLKTSSWEAEGKTKYKTELIAQHVKFLSSKKQND